MDFFSDRELEQPQPSFMIISNEVWQGIKAEIIQLINKKCFALDFSEVCPDNGLICGCDQGKLNAVIHANIPRIDSVGQYWPVVHEFDNPFSEDADVQNEPSEEERTYDILDLIEFCCCHIKDFEEIEYHAFYKHSHIKELSTIKNKSAFIEQINDIFRRNRIAFEVNSDGKINRVIPQNFAKVMATPANTLDDELNKLIKSAREYFLLPKKDDHQIAIEKLWDAFERLKTIEMLSSESLDKKKSANQVVDNLCGNSSKLRDYLLTEAKQLTDIGNDFCIRHHEVDREMIPSAQHLDYLFYRCLAFINLFLHFYNV